MATRRKKRAGRTLPQMVSRMSDLPLPMQKHFLRHALNGRTVTESEIAGLAHIFRGTPWEMFLRDLACDRLLWNNMLVPKTEQLVVRLPSTDIMFSVDCTAPYREMQTILQQEMELQLQHGFQLPGTSLIAESIPTPLLHTPVAMAWAGVWRISSSQDSAHFLTWFTHNAYDPKVPKALELDHAYSIIFPVPDTPAFQFVVTKLVLIFHRRETRFYQYKQMKLDVEEPNTWSFFPSAAVRKTLTADTFAFEHEIVREIRRTTEDLKMSLWRVEATGYFVRTRRKRQRSSSSKETGTKRRRR